jgi:hypothetical protein
MSDCKNDGHRIVSVIIEDAENAGMRAEALFDERIRFAKIAGDLGARRIIIRRINWGSLALLRYRTFKLPSWVRSVRVACPRADAAQRGPIITDNPHLEHRREGVTGRASAACTDDKRSP